jgi:hypothetical protein
MDPCPYSNEKPHGARRSPIPHSYEMNLDILMNINKTITKWQFNACFVPLFSSQMFLMPSISLSSS